MTKKGSAQKKPKSKIPKAGKQPFSLPPSLEDYITWRLEMIDWQGPWPWTTLEGKKKIEVYGKLANFERMTFPESTSKRGAKNIPVHHLGKRAQKRLRDLRYDEFQDQLWEFHLSGKERVWGFRQRSEFFLLWWDPEHEVCPSSK